MCIFSSFLFFIRKILAFDTWSFVLCFVHYKVSLGNHSVSVHRDLCYLFLQLHSTPLCVVQKLSPASPMLKHFGSFQCFTLTSNDANE